MWTKEADGSIVAEDGKVIYFSCERFVRDICLGNCCFICGAAPGSKPFNHEHVLPDWLLSRYRLHSRAITLANDAAFSYGRFTVPCCEECNSLMGRVVESRISRLVEEGSGAIIDFIANGGVLEFYVWLGLIFLKTHLKDREFRYHRDARMGSEKISDFHAWEELHHIHCVVRCFFNGAYVDREAVGSFLTLDIRQDASPEAFDFADLSAAQTMLLRLDNVAFFAVFNDSTGALQFFQQKLPKITGPISEPQAREVMAELAYLNLCLKQRPTFHSLINLHEETCRVVANTPTTIELMPSNLELRGALLERSLSGMLPKKLTTGEGPEAILAAIRAGTLSVLFDDEGRFIEKTLIRPED